MKSFFIVLISLTSFCSIAQNEHIIDVMLDDKPVKLNTKTGEFIYTGHLQSNQNSTLSSNVSYQPETLTGEFHTVAKGETLYSISRRYGVSIEKINILNPNKSTNLSIGQQLKIKNDNDYVTSSVLNNYSNNHSNNFTHTVLKYDTLYSLAKNNNTTVSSLKALNNLSSNTIVVGQVLKLK